MINGILIDIEICLCRRDKLDIDLIVFKIIVLYDYF